ncbi:uncharacterized protein CDV56_107091 [Aspergillus thermomutatus]|uniref:Uncharacterized protein n=1 Tax=Aspergillus thermomutatus TaxID=41047 RepID=A0A397H3U7_ASPTH|nr:uncharacterized protein CDV56_107091 [Aspergillus thermomutatus]RHZ57687.1 hypothetical protein CDV56_107091 [Aspergillus thermomutatus]
MRPQKWPILLCAAASAWIQAVEATDAVRNITVLGPTALHQHTADNFLTCLNATEISYRLYVDEGIATVLPPGNRTIDFSGVDERLLECMKMSTDKVSIAAEDTTEYNENHASSVHTVQVTYAWLVEQGAVGLHAVGTRLVSLEEGLTAREEDEEVNAAGSQLEKRSFSHYSAYLSDFLHCPSDDVRIFKSNKCHSYQTKWKSVEYSNLSGDLYLEMQIWPHHGCQKKQQKKFVVAPLKTSVCYNRNTFSFWGEYVGTKKKAYAWLNRGSG